MVPAISNRALSLAVSVALCGFPSCARSVAKRDGPPPAAIATSATDADAAATQADAPRDGAPHDAAPPPGTDPATPAIPAPLAARTSGPQSLPLDADRAVFYARPLASAALPGPAPWRLVGHLHGICHPPSYSCGKWLGAATDAGVLVCPTGNARCGDAGTGGPPSWEAPTWEELVMTMDADLERSITKVEAKHPGSIRREGAILTGWSRGAFAAPVIARSHPGRWPYLVLIEANVPLSAASLRKAGVRAVALLAGEKGTEIAGERRTHEALEAAGFPSRLIVMKGVAHQYPVDMEALMAEAFGFVLGAPAP